MPAAMMSEASVPPRASRARRSPGGAASMPEVPKVPREPAVPPVRFLGARPTEASLAAELAQERHITLELQRAILPLHDTPFDLPGLRTVVRYLPASQDSRVGGDWYITLRCPTEACCSQAVTAAVTVSRQPPEWRGCAARWQGWRLRARRPSGCSAGSMTLSGTSPPSTRHR